MTFPEAETRRFIRAFYGAIAEEKAMDPPADEVVEATLEMYRAQFNVCLGMTPEKAAEMMRDALKSSGGQK